MPRTARPIEIHKFGGASLANGAAIAQAVAIIRARRPAPMVVVVSAMAGVTDALLDLAAAAIQRGPDSARATVEALCAQHLGAVRALLGPGPRTDELVQTIEHAFAEVEPLAAGLRILRELTPRTTDYLVARGEYLSARIVAAALDTAGCPAAYVDAVEVIHTDGTFGNASPDLARTERSARHVLQPLLARGVVPVVPGFLGAAPDGQVATLGRGGSDLTATLLARVLGAREVSLWKDVPGVLTADPRTVPDARVIPQLHVREAAELAFYGAKVLHPRALGPVLRRSVAVRIRPFTEPASLGTEISRRRTLSAYPVKAVSAIPKQALLTVTGSGMLGVPGIAARAFAAVHHEGISISLISQASSEQSICFSVPEEHAERARKGLAATFRREIARGSSELNLSLVVDGGDAARALRAVHAAFQLSKIGGGMGAHPERSDVVLLGFGQIGRTLAPLIAKVKQNALRLQVVGLVDRSGFVFDPRGLPPRRLAALAAAKAKATPLAKVAGGQRASATEAVTFVASHALSNPILVDVTAADTT